METCMHINTEDRTNPIHPASWLPAKWAGGAEARDSFAGTALKDEYYVWQIALWTPGGALEGVMVPPDAAPGVDRPGGSRYLPERVIS